MRSGKRMTLNFPVYDNTIEWLCIRIPDELELYSHTPMKTPEQGEWKTARNEFHTDEAHISTHPVLLIGTHQAHPVFIISTRPAHPVLVINTHPANKL